MIDRIKLVKPANNQLEKGIDGLMHRKGGGQFTEEASVRVVSGSLESSNVNSVGALVRMIELARQYENHIKIMRSAEDNDKAAAEIIKMA